jgi:hypothetical protein
MTVCGAEGNATVEPLRIQLAGLWTAVMLTYLLGDVLRIFSGDLTPGEIQGHKVTQLEWLGIAALMLVPILMVLVALMLDQPVARWATIVAAVGLFLFNLLALLTMRSAFDQFLIAVTLVLNVLTVWYAWGWTPS